jgi:hypothetical protein
VVERLSCKQKVSSSILDFGIFDIFFSLFASLLSQLMLSEPLLAKLEPLIIRLLRVLDDGAAGASQPKLRAAVMKAVSELVQADPSVMAIPVSVSAGVARIPLTGTCVAIANTSLRIAANRARRCEPPP